MTARRWGGEGGESERAREREREKVRERDSQLLDPEQDVIDVTKLEARERERERDKAVWLLRLTP